MRNILHTAVLAAPAVCVIFIAALALWTPASINGVAPEAFAPAGEAGGAVPATSYAGKTPAPSPVPPAPTPSADIPKLKVGISMPTKSLQRWERDGDDMQAQFKRLGYDVDLWYAGNNEVAMQISQIENMITDGCKVLIIAAIDGGVLTEVLKQAKAKSIPVIAYEYLIVNTDAVNYYVTFNWSQSGLYQARYIANKLALEATRGPYNIEFFTGSTMDGNYGFRISGAKSAFQPYIDSGKLVAKSGQTLNGYDCGIRGFEADEARKRMEALISKCGYGPKGTRLDAVFCMYDFIAQGVSAALEAAGYTADNFPIVTGSGCDKASVINIRKGLQSMSVFADTRLLAERAVTMAQSLLNGEKPEVNDTKTYDNIAAMIPSYLCDYTVVTADNIKECLIDSGYYTWDDIGGPPGSMPMDK